MSGDRDREGWGHPVPGRCPRCGGVSLEPPAGRLGHPAPTWRCRDCGEPATTEQIVGGGPEAAGDEWPEAAWRQ